MAPRCERPCCAEAQSAGARSASGAQFPVPVVPRFWASAGPRPQGSQVPPRLSHPTQWACVQCYVPQPSPASEQCHASRLPSRLLLSLKLRAALAWVWVFALLDSFAQELVGGRTITVQMVAVPVARKVLDDTYVDHSSSTTAGRTTRKPSLG